MRASQHRQRRLLSSAARLTLAAGVVLISAAGFTATASAFSTASPAQDPTEGRPTPRATPVKTPTPRTPTPRPRPMFDVTFKTDLPASDIYEDTGGMSRRSLGRTDANGTLTVKMSGGRHVVSASRVGSPYQKQTIQVGPNSTSFSFTLGSAAPPTPEAEPSPTPVVSETPDAPAGTDGDGAATEAAASDEVFKRYLDMSAPAPPGESDWESVVRQTTAELEREPGVSLPRAQQLFAQGQLAYMRGSHADALVRFRAAEVEQPSLTAVHYGLGTAYLATKQPKEAFKAFQQAAKLDPKLALAYKGMGDALTAQNKKKEAERYYAQARSLGGAITPAPSTDAAAGATPAPASLASLRDLVKRKRYNDALPNLTILSEQQPSADVFIVLGDAYVGLKQPLSAAPAYRRAMELDGQSALAAYSYGKLMFELNEFSKAMEALERALALDQTGAGIDKKRAREMADRARERLIRPQ